MDSSLQCLSHIEPLVDTIVSMGKQGKFAKDSLEEKLYKIFYMLNPEHGWAEDFSDVRYKEGEVVTDKISINSFYEQFYQLKPEAFYEGYCGFANESDFRHVVFEYLLGERDSFYELRPLFYQKQPSFEDSECYLSNSLDDHGTIIEEQDGFIFPNFIAIDRSSESDKQTQKKVFQSIATSQTYSGQERMYELFAAVLNAKDYHFIALAKSHGDGEWYKYDSMRDVEKVLEEQEKTLLKQGRYRTHERYFYCTTLFYRDREFIKNYRMLKQFNQLRQALINFKAKLVLLAQRLNELSEALKFSDL